MSNVIGIGRNAPCPCGSGEKYKPRRLLYFDIAAQLLEPMDPELRNTDGEPLYRENTVLGRIAIEGDVLTVDVNSRKRRELGI
jgi:hypothetical protein